MIFFEEIAQTIAARAAQAPAPFLVGIDGRCGSGKTTLAAYLQEKLSAAVLHIDDFYLPFSLRSEQRMQQVGGHIDIERLRAECLSAACLAKPFSYRAFRPHTQKWLTPQAIKSNKIYIVEGSYSCLPGIKDVYHFKIFLTLCQQVQTARLLQREGAEKLQTFLNRWIVAEEQYFSLCATAQSADKVYDTSAWW